MIPSRWRFPVYIALAAVSLINYVDRINLSVAASSIATEFHLSSVQMGFMFSAYLWTYTLFLVPVGLLVDRFGPYVITGISLFVWSIAGAATGVADNLAVLIASRLVLGLGEASNYPANGRVIRDWAPAHERGIATAIFNSGAYVGLAAGAIGIGWVIHSYGWRQSFMVSGGLGVAMSIVWFLTMRAPAAASLMPQKLQDDPPPLTALTCLLRSRSMWGVAFAQFCAGYGLYFLMSWTPRYLELKRGVPVLNSAIYTAVPYAVAAVCSLVTGYLSDFISKRFALNPSRVRRCFIAALLLIAAIVAFVPQMQSITGCTILLCVAVSGVSAVVGLNVALTTDLLGSARYAGLALSLLILGGNIAGVIAPIVTGFVVQSADFESAFRLSGLVLVVGGLCAWSLTSASIQVNQENEPTPVTAVH